MKQPLHQALPQASSFLATASLARAVPPSPVDTRDPVSAAARAGRRHRHDVDAPPPPAAAERPADFGAPGPS